VQYGGQELGIAAARELYGRVDIADSLESIFALADMDGNGTLGYAEFLLFMYLLKVLRKGVMLPKRLTHERVSLPAAFVPCPSVFGILSAILHSCALPLYGTGGLAIRKRLFLANNKLVASFGTPPPPPHHPTTPFPSTVLMNSFMSFYLEFILRHRA